MPIRTTYEPRPSAYTRAYLVICDLYKEQNHIPLTEEQVERRIKCTPGLMFAEGVTLDEVYGTLGKWRLLFRGNVHDLGERFIPLDWNSLKQT